MGIMSTRRAFFEYVRGVVAGGVVAQIAPLVGLRRLPLRRLACPRKAWIITRSWESRRLLMLRGLIRI